MFDDISLSGLSLPVRQKAERLWDLFPDDASVSFDGNRFVSSGCAACRRCCRPQDAGDKPYPMRLLDSQVSERTPEDFYLQDRHTALLDQRGCKSLGSLGCSLPVELRPMACGLFPFVLGGGSLLLYVFCPAVLRRHKAMLAISGQVFDHLASLPKACLERISIPVAEESLGTVFVDLGFPKLF